MSDTRVVYGAHCTWWDSIDKVGTRSSRITEDNPISIPCCPHCKNVLFELPNEDAITKGLDEYNKKQPGYKDMFLWSRGKCFRDWDTLLEAYEKEKARGQEDQATKR